MPGPAHHLEAIAGLAPAGGGGYPFDSEHGPVAELGLERAVLGQLF